MKITMNIGRLFIFSLIYCLHISIISSGQDCNTRLLVAYTQSAANTFGNTPFESINNRMMKQAIREEIMKINVSFASSNINHQVEEAAIERVEEIPTSCYYIDFSFLQLSDDGYWDNLHALRDYYRADVVVLVVDNADICGISGKRFDASEAFVMVGQHCLNENFSLGRQLGYLYGCGNHEDLSGRFGPVNFPLSEVAHGFWHEDFERDFSLSTIMGYTDDALSSHLGNPNLDDFNMIPYWSNPEIVYQHPAYGPIIVGDDDHNNAAVINQNGSVIATYRNNPTSHTVFSDIVRSNETARALAADNLLFGSDDDMMIVEEGGELHGEAEFKVTVKKARFARGSKVTLSTNEAQPCPVHHPITARMIKNVLGLVQSDELEVEKKNADSGNLVTIYPNPLAYETNIQYRVEQGGTPVHMAIYDLNGMVITELIKDASHDAGRFTLTWKVPYTLPKNIYICKIVVGNQTAINKMVIIR